MTAMRVPGRLWLALAAALFDERTVRMVIEPTVADLQHEVREAGQHRRRRWRALWLGHAACLRAGLIGLALRRWPMRRDAVAVAVAAGCGAVVLWMLAATAVWGTGLEARLHMAASIVVFTGMCVVALLPFVAAVWFIGSRWSTREALRAAFLVVPLGFLAGGCLGWALVPDIWPASLWVTIDAAMNAARFGDQFENLAEHVLMYPLYLGIVGATGAAVLSLLALKLSARSVAE
jgi:hypothetical protein